MRIYVDAAIHRWRGKLWCHMFSPNIDDLHQFAREIGMRREWFQDPRTSSKISWPHYDISAQRRQVALSLGAIAVGRHQTIAMSRRSEEHTSELQSLMRISYAVFCLNKKKITKQTLKSN